MPKNRIRKSGKTCKMELYDRSGAVVAEAIFDFEDREKVGALRWYLSGKGYVVAHTPLQIPKLVCLHQIVTGQTYLDHRNRNKLDNRKSNLRKVTHSQNKMNRAAPSNNKTGIKGVCFVASRNRWVATMLMRGKIQLQKRFKNKADAIKQRKEWEKKYFGQYA